MKISSQNRKIIFGLKVKHLRQQKKLSFTQLSKASKVSVSYLNEIEKGKKYPKRDKIDALSKALDTTYDDLVSNELGKQYGPLQDLLKSNFLKELPLDLFGVDMAKVAELIAGAPTKVGAFISTLLEVSRNYELDGEHFFFAALRHFQAMKHNYFEEIELKVDAFNEQFNLTSETTSINRLQQILEEEFGYTIEMTNFHSTPTLKGMRAIFQKDRKRLLVNKEVNDNQKAFLLAKEIGYNVLKLETRIYTSTFLKIKNFQLVLNNFNAAYFAGALLINHKDLCDDMKGFFELPTWQPERLSEIMKKYLASPEMFLHRLTSLLPKYFGIKKLFFFRFNNTPVGSDEYILTKELNLSERSFPHGSGQIEHYCRRWITLWLLKDLDNVQKAGTYKQPIIGAQRSQYMGSDTEYLCIALARPAHPTPDTNVSVTLALLIDDDLRKSVAFLEDENITVEQVSHTCERCPATDCKERVAPARILEQEKKQNQMEEEMKKLLG